MVAVLALRRLRGAGSEAIILSATSNLIIQLGNLATGVVLARSLGPTARGHVAALAAICLTVSLVTAVSLADGAMFIAARNVEKVRVVIGSSMLVLVATMLAGVGLLAAETPLLMKVAATDRVWDVAPWVLCAGLSQAGGFVQALARSLERFSLWFWLRVLSTWNYAAVLILFALTVGLDARLTGIAMCAGAAGTTAVGALFLFRQLHPIEASRAVAGQVVRYGVKMHPATIALLTRDQLDKVILILLVSASEVGKYVVALALSSLIVSAASSIDQAIFPRLSAVLDSQARRKAYLRLMKWLAPLPLLGGPPLLAVSPQLAAIVFGARFADQPWLIICGGALGLLNMVKVLANVGLKIENRPGVLGANETAGSIIGLASLPVFVKTLGILGAPLATGLGAAVSLALTLFAISRQYAREASTADGGP